MQGDRAKGIHDRLDTAMALAINEMQAVKVAMNMGGTCKPRNLNCRESHVVDVERTAAEFAGALERLNKACFRR